MRFDSAVRKAGLVVAIAALAVSAGCAKKDESEVQAWLDSRPTAPKPAPKVKGRRGRPRNAERVHETTA